jgi:hypothetical protein
MTFLVKKSNLRTVKPGDPLFTITDGLVMAKRAGFEINKDCPKEYKLIISTCIANGWLMPVATMTTEEQFIETLKL